jgi:hypothetical protein
MPGKPQSKGSADPETLPEAPPKPPFWSSLPGMLTGIGGVIVAVTGLITALYSSGAIGTKAGADPKPSPSNMVALASTPDAKPAESDRYKGLTGRWEIIDVPVRKASKQERITWDCEGAVSGNTFTLKCKIIAVGPDKNLTKNEEARRLTIVTPLLGLSGVGRYEEKDAANQFQGAEVTLHIDDDLKNFDGRYILEDEAYKLTGRKL